MSVNPLLKKLGYSDTDRLVIVHVDDVGMTQASVQAFADLWEFGAISSGAVMAPCPWFPAAAEWARRHPEADLGVHATLNSEWSAYRWGPLSTHDPATGLLDGEGYFHRRQPPVEAQARSEAVAAELEAQVERALMAGLDVTHIDSHMGTILHPRFVQSYVQAAARRRLPAMLPRAGAVGFEMMGVGPAELEVYAPILSQMEAEGLPMLDGLFSMPLEDPADHIGVAKSLLGQAPAGITHFILHPAADTPELRAACPDWPSRVANYAAFMSQDLKDFIRQAGLHLVGYRPIREALRAQAGA